MTRVAPLEQKLDRLADLLETQGSLHLQQNLLRDNTHDEEAHTRGTLPVNLGGVDAYTSSTGRNSEIYTTSPGKESPLSIAPVPSGILPCPGEPSAVLAEQYLATFRTHMLQFFPIIHIHAGMTSQQLRKDKPFLWLCIMTVACSSTQQQMVLGDSVREIISREIVFKSKKNLDFLLGTLTFIAWYVSLSCAIPTLAL